VLSKTLLPERMIVRVWTTQCARAVPAGPIGMTTDVEDWIKPGTGPSKPTPKPQHASS
jgi:hypothetical protein